MGSTGQRMVPLTSVGAKMARKKGVGNSGEDMPYTTRIIDNMVPVDNRMIDERILDHVDLSTDLVFPGNIA